MFAPSVQTGIVPEETLITSHNDTTAKLSRTLFCHVLNSFLFFHLIVLNSMHVFEGFPGFSDRDGEHSSFQEAPGIHTHLSSSFHNVRPSKKRLAPCKRYAQFDDAIAAECKKLGAWNWEKSGLRRLLAGPNQILGNVRQWIHIIFMFNIYDCLKIVTNHNISYINIQVLESMMSLDELWRRLVMTSV